MKRRSGLVDLIIIIILKDCRYCLKYVDLFLKARTLEAQKLIDENYMMPQHGMRYLTMGSLFLNFPGHENPSEYYRDLNLENATATTRYAVDGVKFVRTAFASLSDDVIIVRIQADKAKALNFAVSYSSPLKSDVQVKGGKLIISCQGAEHEGIPAAMRAECQVQVKTDGKVSKEESALAVKWGYRSYFVHIGGYQFCELS